MRYFSDFIIGLFSNELAIDLGTTNTLIYMPKKRAIVLQQPSMVAIDKDINKIIAVGDEAKRMLGRTPENIDVIRPLRDGAIADIDVTEAMLRFFIRKASNRQRFTRPLVVITVPSVLTKLEQTAVVEAAQQAGARKVYLIKQPIAGAIGAGMTVQQQADCNFIIDIGGGTTDLAIISYLELVRFQMIKIAGDEFDETIIRYIRHEHNVLIGQSTAEEIKKQIGSVAPLDEELQIEVQGRSLATGYPESIKVSSEEIREALSKPIEDLLNAANDLMEETPPDLISDVVENGLILTGGGALLRSIEKLFQKSLGIPAKVVDNPIECVANGAGKVLSQMRTFQSVLINSKYS